MQVAGSPVLLRRPVCVNCGTVGYSASGPEPCPKAATGLGEWSVIYRTSRYGWHCLKTFPAEQPARAELARIRVQGFDAELLSSGVAAARAECSRRNDDGGARCE